MISSLTTEGNALDRVAFTKCLGAYIDENMNLNEHISFVTNNVAKLCGQ